MPASATFRLRWPLLVLLASIGLTAFAAFDAQRMLRSQSAVVERAIREFSSFAAWSYGEHLEQRLAVSAAEVLGAVNHGGDMHTNPGVPEAADLVHYLPDDRSCDCHRTRRGPNPAAFFGFKLGTTRVDVARNLFAYPSEGWRVDPVPNQPLPPSTLYPEAERQWIADTLNVHARAVRRDGYGYGMILGRFDGKVRPITYTLMPTAWGDTIVYGVEYTPAAFNRMLSEVLDDSGLLPESFTKGTRNRNVVAVRVLDGASQTIYESMPGVRSRTATTLALSPAYGSISAHVMIRPDQASGLIIGGMPSSRLPMVGGLLLIATALTIIAFLQIRRETELARTRSDFVASISHELRTPLAQIKLYLETLRLGRAETPEKREWSLGHIDRETTRLSNLVENVLRFSRLGRADEKAAESIDVATEAARIVEEFAPLAASRKASVELVAEARPMVRIRPEALRHILVNLLDNAVRYGPQGQTITVQVAGSGRTALLSVSDQGKGVPKPERESIWKAFTRVPTATGAAGSGIGLTIVRDLVIQNGGTVSVGDAPDGGAQFAVSLPSTDLPTRPTQAGIVAGDVPEHVHAD
jgi:signal transduction histidine kinase